MLQKRYLIHQAVWLFAACCMVGFLMESMESLYSLGYVQNRQGLLYGPFTPVYGAGAILFALCQPILKKRQTAVLFAASALLGSTLEYLWSLAQEELFGAVFWDYSGLPFQLDGRVSALFTLYWGLLGVIFFKGLYQPFFKFIARLPRLGRGLVTWVLIVLLMGDIILSSCALFRQRARQYAVAANSSIEIFLDQTYSDAHLQNQFPNMRLRVR